MRTVVAAIIGLVIVVALGVALHMAYGIGWFTFNSGTVPPQDKAEALRGLLDSPRLKAAAYGSAAIVAGIAFPFMARTSNILSGLLYSAAAGFFVLLSAGLGAPGIIAGASSFGISVGLHAMIRRPEAAEAAGPPNKAKQAGTR
jgi:hypothetical protein